MRDTIARIDPEFRKILDSVKRDIKSIQLSNRNVSDVTASRFIALNWNKRVVIQIKPKSKVINTRVEDMFKEF